VKSDDRSNRRRTSTSRAEAANKVEAAFTQLPSSVAAVARRLVAMRWFNETAIAALAPENTPKEQQAQVAATITSLPFVERVSEGYAYPPLARQGLLERYQREWPDELKAACKAAATALAESFEDDTIGVETFYCAVAAGETKDAHNQLHDLVNRFLARQDWEWCRVLHTALADAEALSFVQPLPRTGDYYVMRGMAQAAQGKLPQAIKDLNKALERQPTLAWAVAQRGEINARMGNDDLALADMARAAFMAREVVAALATAGSLNRLVDAYQQNPDAFPQARMEGFGKLAEGLGAVGEAARVEGRTEEALAYFQRALALSPDIAWVYASRGALYVGQKRYEEALAETTRAIELDPKYAWALGNRGRIYRLMGRNEEALADINRSIEIQPTSGALGERGEIYRQQGRLDEAMEDLEHALRLNGRNAVAAAGRARVLKARGQYFDALAEMHRSIAVAAADDPADLTTRGELHVYFQNWDDALSDFSRAIELQPDNTEAVADRAQVYLELERYDEAAADFGWLIERHPELAWAFVQRGRAHLAQRRYAEALADLDEALQRSADDQEALAIRGRTHLQMGSYEKALADLNQALALDPQDDLALASRAEALLRQGNIEAALGDLDAALALRPDDDWSLYRRALAHQALGHSAEFKADMAAAIDAARKRHDEEPSDCSNSLNLALYELAAGRHEEAERVYRQALAEGPAARQVSQAIADLDELIALRPGYDQALALRQLLREAEADLA